MSKRVKVVCVVLAIPILSVGAALAEGNVERGAQVFRACAVCHSTQPGEHLTGPSLADVWRRKAGTAKGFQRYSEPMKRSGVTWNGSTLDKWLTDPAAFIPGASMMFPGLRSRGDREDVIAYLHAVSEGTAPPTPKGGGMMGGGMMGGGMMSGGMMGGRGMMGGKGGMMGGAGMMGGGKVDLKHAPPEGQVTKLTHCGDTYTVTTADGRVEKVWEFNLRLKTDSSVQGPTEGKPVIVGAGMRGDRASVVFAKPSEITAFIGAECRDSK